MGLTANLKGLREKMRWSQTQRTEHIGSHPHIKGAMMGQIQYISDENQTITAVIVPIELWRELQAEKEMAYLLKSETMNRPLLTAENRKGGISFDEARERLGV